jgi:hypothetical protein
MFAAVDVALIRSSTDRELSHEFALLMALVVFDGYTLFPAHADCDAPAGQPVRRPTAREAIASRVETGARWLIARMWKWAKHV